MFRVKPRVTLGLKFFTVLIQKSEKQWKVLGGCLKNLHREFPRVISLMTTSVDFQFFSPLECQSSSRLPVFCQSSASPINSCHVSPYNRVSCHNSLLFTQ